MRGVGSLGGEGEGGEEGMRGETETSTETSSGGRILEKMTDMKEGFVVPALAA